METSILEDATALSAMSIDAVPVSDPAADLEVLRGIILAQYAAGKIDSFVCVAVLEAIGRVRKAVVIS